ncbi:MAG: hypothetical protein RBS37_08605 [Bacteroidales bacterium]|nr:hypothetical protein [Bacteroidales bacterium]
MKKALFLLAILFLLKVPAFSQAIDSSNEHKLADSTVADPRRTDALNIFLDCDRCDRTYIKEVIPFVNYVNNKDDADLFIMVTQRATGGGGTEHLVSFSGQRNFKGINDTLTFFNPPNTSADFTRQGQANILAMGLMRYVARTPLSQNISINYREPVGSERRSLSQVVEDDPWNSWVFRLSSRGSMSKDQNYENISSENTFSSDRVTPQWKSEFDFSYEFRQRNIITDGVVSKYPRTDWSFRTLQVKSISNHLSVGASLSSSGSSYGNIKYSLNLHPAIEYNIYPYSESFKRQIRIQYTLQMNYANYMDTTKYFKMEETIYRHQLAVAVGFNQPWGSSNFSIRGGHFLNDLEFWNFNMFGDISWRVYKGLSVSFNARASIIRDERAVLKGDASLEDVLLQLRKLNSTYSYSFGFGLSYSFGSIYNNMVNPRFSSR